MSDAVLVALITGACAVLGQLIISLAQAAKRKIDEAARDARREEWEKSVDKKLDEHNGYAKLFASVQTDIAVIKNDIKTLYNK